MTKEERDALRDSQIDVLRVRSLDEHTKLEELEHRVKELEQQVALILGRLQHKGEN